MSRTAIYSRKWIILGVLTTLSFSCKSTKVISGGSADESLSARTVIKNHYRSELDFKTLSGRIKVAYADGTSAQNVSVSLRMEKDSIIWMSAPLGVVKAYISPKRVSFYNKLNNEYFDGDFTYLSELLGTSLNFKKVQDLLLGQAIFDLRDERYDLQVEQGHYELKPRKIKELFKVMFRIEPKNFKMGTQQLAQPWKKRLLEIEYKNYQQEGNRVFPNEVKILAIEKDQQTSIAIDYKNIEFDRPLNFPYKIPKGFDEIVLK